MTCRTCRITPFGYPGVNGYVLLSPAFRSLSRPSSPYSSQASAINLYSLDHIIFSASATCAFPNPLSFKHGFFLLARNRSFFSTDILESCQFPSFLCHFKKRR